MNPVKVYSYSPEGDLIKEYYSLLEASNDVFNKTKTLFTNYTFKVHTKGVLSKVKIEEPLKVQQLFQSKGNPLVTRKSDRKVLMYNIKGELVATFVNLTIAAKLTGISQSTISCMVDHNHKEIPKNKYKCYFKTIKI